MKIDKRKWICKSDITKEKLFELGLSFYSVGYIKKLIENLSVDNVNVRIMIVGNEINKKMQRHTKYVFASYLYKILIKN